MVKRIQQVNQLLKRELSQIILKEVEFPTDILVTVTRVETSPNLNQAKVYVSVMSFGQRIFFKRDLEKPNQKVIETLNRKIYDLQQKINKRLKMRPVPRIKFIEEKETKRAGRVEELLEKIKKGKS